MRGRFWVQTAPKLYPLSLNLLRQIIPQLFLECMAGTTGLEPATSAVTGQRSNQLNYVPGWVSGTYFSSEPDSVYQRRGVAERVETTISDLVCVFSAIFLRTQVYCGDVGSGGSGFTFPGGGGAGGKIFEGGSAGCRVNFQPGSEGGSSVPAGTAGCTLGGALTAV
jgi:hypothetical protein